MPDSPRGWKNPSSAATGLLGGRPPGTESKDKRTYPPDALIEAQATALLHGSRSMLTLGPPGEVTSDDKRMLARVSGVPYEEYIQRLSSRLRDIADKTATRIEEKLDANEARFSDLSYLLGVTVDKMQALSSRQAQTGTNVNVQINNFGGTGKIDRTALMAAIKGAPVDLPQEEVKP